LKFFSKIFLSQNDKEVTKNGKKINGSKIDRREPLATVNRKLARPGLGAWVPGRGPGPGRRELWETEYLGN